MDLFAKLEKQMGPIGEYMNQADGYFTFPKLEGPLGNRMVFQGREVICWMFLEISMLSLYGWYPR